MYQGFKWKRTWHSSYTDPSSVAPWNSWTLTQGAHLPFSSRLKFPHTFHLPLPLKTPFSGSSSFSQKLSEPSHLLCGSLLPPSPFCPPNSLIVGQGQYQRVFCGQGWGKHGTATFPFLSSSQPLPHVNTEDCGASLCHGLGGGTALVTHHLFISSQLWLLCVGTFGVESSHFALRTLKIFSQIIQSLSSSSPPPFFINLKPVVHHHSPVPSGNF